MFSIIHISIVDGDLLYKYKAMRRMVGSTLDGRMEFYQGSYPSHIVGFTNPDKDYTIREMVVFLDESHSPFDAPDTNYPDQHTFSELLEASDRFFEVHDEIAPLPEMRARLIRKV
ncbi:hypothetical protein ACQR3P_29265 [Rhodococcus sp. IEGM1300]